VKIKIASTILILSLFFLTSPGVFAWTGKVVGVADGDTIKVLREGKQISIRLYGIDTPEKRQAYGNRAKKFTNALVRGKRVDIDPISIDRYGRIVAMVHVHGKSLNRLLIRSGYAWVYRKYCKKAVCAGWYQDEEQAKSSGKGLWCDSNPMPPWKWRQEKRHHK